MDVDINDNIEDNIININKNLCNKDLCSKEINEIVDLNNDNKVMKHSFDL